MFKTSPLDEWAICFSNLSRTLKYMSSQKFKHHLLMYYANLAVSNLTLQQLKLESSQSHYSFGVSFDLIRNSLFRGHPKTTLTQLCRRVLGGMST